MSPQPSKKPRLIIIKKEQQKVSTADSTAAAIGGRTPPTIACTRFNNKTWQEREQWLATNQTRYEQIYKRPLKCIYGSPREISHTKIPPEKTILVIEMNNDENKIIGIGEIKNQTANEVYRSSRTAQANNSNQNAASHSTGTATATAIPSQGGGTPSPLAGGGNAPGAQNKNVVPSQGGGTPGGTPTVMNYKIFSDRNYTRYIYIGNTYYATREELERNHTPDAQYINEQLMNQLPQTPQKESVIRYLEQILFKGPKHMKRGSGITKIHHKD